MLIDLSFLWKWESVFSHSKISNVADAFSVTEKEEQMTTTVSITTKPDTPENESGDRTPGFFVFKKVGM